MWRALRRWGIILGIFSTIGVYGASVDVVAPSAFSGVQFCNDLSSPGPGCQARPFDTAGNLAFLGTVVAKDIFGGGSSAVHQIAHINDGNYGNGASWIGASANSWIKIDLGQALLIDRVKFGRDRLGLFDDRDPGNFTVEVALTDGVFADGNDTDDSTEYVLALDSTTAAGGFTGTISGADTIQASFDSVSARYVKITFAVGGAAIDEVEVLPAAVVPTLTEWGIILLILGLAVAAVFQVKKLRLSEFGV